MMSEENDSMKGKKIGRWKVKAKFCLRRPYKPLWKEEKQTAKEKRKNIPIWK